jgi:hypothetical protein
VKIAANWRFLSFQTKCPQLQLGCIFPAPDVSSSCMFSGSPKKIALGQIIIAILLSVVSGMFFMQGLEGALRGDSASWAPLVLSPALLAIAILHGRRVWQAIR